MTPRTCPASTCSSRARAPGWPPPWWWAPHVHPAVPQAKVDPPAPTGVDYLGLVLAAHVEAGTGSISYRDVPLFDEDEELDAGHDNDESDDEAVAVR